MLTTDEHEYLIDHLLSQIHIKILMATSTTTLLKNTLAYANALTGDKNSTCCTTHILTALLQMPETYAYKVFTEYKVAINDEIGILSTVTSEESKESTQHSVAVQTAMLHAASSANRRVIKEIDTGDLLLGLLSLIEHCSVSTHEFFETYDMNYTDVHNTLSLLRSDTQSVTN